MCSTKWKLGKSVASCYLFTTRAFSSTLRSRPWPHNGRLRTPPWRARLLPCQQWDAKLNRQSIHHDLHWLLKRLRGSSRRDKEEKVTCPFLLLKNIHAVVSSWWLIFERTGHCCCTNTQCKLHLIWRWWIVVIQWIVTMSLFMGLYFCACFLMFISCTDLADHDLIMVSHFHGPMTARV